MAGAGGDMGAAGLYCGRGGAGEAVLAEVYFTGAACAGTDFAVDVGRVVRCRAGGATRVVGSSSGRGAASCGRPEDAGSLRGRGGVAGRGGATGGSGTCGVRGRPASVLMLALPRPWQRARLRATG
ncbi:hypothetical protein N566_00720 [Streptomycetaceae bacterium MP113-05]|nr:hypothetical protein N566_00720 [Streptomycetaceae bacterium MP113-05]